MNAASTASPEAEIPAMGNLFAGLVSVSASAADSANDSVTYEPEGGEAAPSDNVGTTRAIFRGDANVKLRRVVGPRLLKARELSGLGQAEAAGLLGYSTPAQLNQWEYSRRLPPIFEIIKAANLYSVSLDYLVGESNEPERDPALALRHATLRGVRGMLHRVAEATVDQVARHARIVGPNVGNVRGLLAAGEGLLEALAAFVRANSGAFQNQRGSATVVRLMQEFETALDDARKRVALHDSLDGDLRRALAEIGDADPLPLEDGET
ncbi:helix-turn-helix domain-containing protein [Variovorax paradoxus]|uniref:helix-turn-helix domain-containing protein n=1 Tax=Variovorax paradoxus TaxID=34073 RepID=UPI002783C588|nr:helix-turn-helix transcriptional regulator [Variovorax paradoxus]MDQ0590997.1 transcriptional regulator with XRE-family HTH domain [Variovorax paradoxus]